LLYKISILFVVFFITLTSQAQLCTGSLGDPVVDIDFGQGPNPGPALPTNVTTGLSYVYPCPNDGQYAIVNSSSGCYQGAWWAINSDHTGNPNGYFMQINASENPSVFYLDTVHGLCPNTTFEFASWVMDMLTSNTCGSGFSILPNIEFTIETTTGDTLGKYFTGDIPVNTSGPVWTQFGFYFKTLPGTSDVVLRMRNVAPGGCGNDLALDDITFRPCGPMINTYINNSSSDSIDICVGQPKSFTFKSSVSQGYLKPSFQWQQNIDGVGWVDIAGATDTILTRSFSAVGTYAYRLSVADSGNIGIANCRIASNAVSVNIRAYPNASISKTGEACIGKNLTLSVQSTSTYAWSGPNNFTSTDSAITFTNLTPANAGKYYINVFNIYGCASVDSILVTVDADPVATAIADTSICLGKSVNLNGSGGMYYLWQPATGLSSDSIANPIATPADTTAYTLKITDAHGCTDTTSVHVNTLLPPTVKAGPNQAILQGESAQITASVTGSDINYYWLPDVYIKGDDLLTAIVNPPSDTTYTLYAVSNDGCGTATGSVFVRVYQKLMIPNAFSPNGDGINDLWKITPIDAYTNAEITVFDRYGQTVFHTTNFAPWNGTINGKPLPVGTYYYLIDLKVNLPKLSGWVEVLR
jgi:gliding motility-associated-like protein